MSRERTDSLNTCIPHPRVQAVMDVPTAGRLVGLGRSAAYDAARRGQLPVIAFGRKLVVPVAQMWRLLGLDLGESPAATTPGSADPARTVRPLMEQA